MRGVRVFIILLLLAVVSGGFWFYRRTVSSSGVVSPLPEEQTDRNIFTFLFHKSKKDISELVPIIKNLIKNESGAYSIYVIDLTSGESVGINETRVYIAASINKIPILASLYYEAQRGNVDLDERITVQATDIQDYGTGIIRNEGPGGVYSLKTLAELMMQKSDNTAAYILSNKLDQNHIQELLGSWSLTQTNMAENKTSNRDIGILLRKMYLGQIANQSLTSEMFGFMTDSDFETRLPAKLPKSVKIYHKIGTEIGALHDVGIVEIPNAPYYIGVFTGDINAEAKAETEIAQISKVTYDFMTNR